MIFFLVNLTYIFQGHLLQELDDQIQCDHFGENLMKIGWIVSEIFNLFQFFL